MPITPLSDQLFSQQTDLHQPWMVERLLPGHPFPGVYDEQTRYECLSCVGNLHRGRPHPFPRLDGLENFEIVPARSTVGHHRWHGNIVGPLDHAQ